MGTIGIGQMLIIFVIVLIIFGPKNLPKVGQALGRGIREFKDAARGLSAELEEDERRSDKTRREIDCDKRNVIDSQASPASQPKDRETLNS